MLSSIRSNPIIITAIIVLLTYMYLKGEEKVTKSEKDNGSICRDLIMVAVASYISLYLFVPSNINSNEKIFTGEPQF